MRSISIVLFAGFTAACGPLVQIGGNDEPPPSLLTLSTAASPANTPTGAPLLVEVPVVPGALQTLRIPVTTRATEIAYLKNANWVEQPNRLFQRLLADVVQARTGRPVLTERNTDVTATNLLSGRLEAFGLDVRDSAPQVRVRFDALLSSPKTGLVGAHSFEASAPVASEAGPDVARALNAAANTVASEIGDWVAQFG